jgi:hypothetical protein
MPVISMPGDIASRPGCYLLEYLRLFCPCLIRPCRRALPQLRQLSKRVAAVLQRCQQPHLLLIHRAASGCGKRSWRELWRRRLHCNAAFRAEAAERHSSISAPLLLSASFVSGFPAT